MSEGQKHLLIVDDEGGLREAIAERLADHGFLVEQADSGERALQRLSEFAFDILITDLRLPGIDGRQVMGTRRSTATRRSSPSSSPVTAP